MTVLAPLACSCRRALFAASLLVITIGCDSRPETYPVRGRVHFPNGDPVRIGIVELDSLDQQDITATGRIQEDGTFVLGTWTPDDGAVAGRHNAIVLQLIVDEGLIRHERDHGAPVDPRFSSHQTSGLQVTIEAIEQNELDLEVTRAPQAREQDGGPPPAAVD